MSPAELPNYDEALDAARRATTVIDDRLDVALHEADGLTLDEPIVADRDMPPFNRAQMDGYALRHDCYQTASPMPVVGDIAAGQPPDVAIPEGACVRIATGAPVPDDADTVIPHEWSDRGDPVRFDHDAPTIGHAIHPRGADARAGDELVARRTILGPNHLGLAASVGRTTVRVIRPPVVRIVTSGDEVRPIGSVVQPHQIRNANGIMIGGMASRCGAGRIEHDHLPDGADVTSEHLGEALAHADIVVTIGGVSVGARDFIPAALDAHGVDVIVRGAAIQPGKPIRIGRAPSGTMVVALPGNPVSALVTACLFLRPIIRWQCGDVTPMPWQTRPLAHDVRSNPRRTVFRPCIASDDGITVPTWSGSGDLAHTSDTTGIVMLPRHDGDIAAGETRPYHPWP